MLGIYIQQMLYKVNSLEIHGDRFDRIRRFVQNMMSRRQTIYRDFVAVIRSRKKTDRVLSTNSPVFGNILRSCDPALRLVRKISFYRRHDVGFYRFSFRKHMAEIHKSESEFDIIITNRLNGIVVNDERNCSR